MKQLITTLGAIYVTVAIAMASFGPSSKVSRVNVAEEKTRQAGSYTDTEAAAPLRPERFPETPEYIDGKPVKYQMFDVPRQKVKETKDKPEIDYPDNYLLIWTVKWCRACEDIKVIGDKLEAEGYDVFYIDFDANKKKAKKNQIASLPTSIVYTNGEEVKRIMGLGRKNKKTVETQIKEVLKKNETDDYDIY